MNNFYNTSYIYKKLKNFITIFLLMLNSVFTNSDQFRFSGNIDLIYASRLSDLSTLRLPYRLIKIDIGIKGNQNSGQGKNELEIVEDSINSNITTLLILLLLSLFSLSNLDIDIKNILFEAKYFISEVLTFESAQHAEIICKSSGVCSIIFFKNFFSIKKFF